MRLVPTLLALAGLTLSVVAANPPATTTGSSAASPLPSASPAGKLPGNDPSLFATSVPMNTGPAVAGGARFTLDELCRQPAQAPGGAAS